MLTVTIPASEQFDEEKQEFISTKAQTLQLEHSLVSLSKWEARWKKPYLSDAPKSKEEIYDYFRCMTVGAVPEDYVYRALSADNIKEIADYINDPMTATTVYEFDKKHSNKTVVTSELIYYWMIAQNIPPEYEKWHLNRLMMLIKVCSIKNNPKQRKMSRQEIARQNRAINAARRQKYGTKG